MKTVGVIIRESNFEGTNYLSIRKDMFNTLNNFDITIVAIPIYIDFKKILAAINNCDGVILSGGTEILENDYALVKYLYQFDIPTMGICMGMQTMAMAYNGRWEEKIENHQSNDKYVHDIIINKESLLYEIIKKNRITVNSRHNWCVPHTSFSISAKSTDNVIEAIEDKNKRFFLGIQWHPESLNDENTYLLFKYYVDKL